MLTKKILKYVRKAEKAELAGYDGVSGRYRLAAVELTKQCKNVTEDEFVKVFDHAPIDARDTYWLAMHAKEQWEELDEAINDYPYCPLCGSDKISSLTKLGEQTYWSLICDKCGCVFNTAKPVIKHAEMDASGKVHVEYYPTPTMTDDTFHVVDVSPDERHHETINEYLKKRGLGAK